MNSQSSAKDQLNAWEAIHDAPGSLGRAVRIAREAHTGQVDKSGADYIGHPLRVMDAVETAEAKTVAVLHDVVEDTPVTFDDLRAAGFSEPVIAAVDALTKRKGEPLADSMARVVAIPLARTVKLADIADNSNPTRLALLPVVERVRLQKKYAETRRLLGDQ
jgi:(p)ppGpp synthase/HD superfamily hydrolase